VEFIETKKGELWALYNKYAYRKHSVNKGVVTLICLKEKSNKCKGRLVTNNGVVVRVSDHQCVPDEASTDVKKKSTARRKGQETTPRRLYRNCSMTRWENYTIGTTNLSLINPNFRILRVLYSGKEIKHRGYRKKQKAPRKWLLTKIGWRWLMEAAFCWPATLMIKDGNKSRISTFSVLI
jgi:hypothetical protein